MRYFSLTFREFFSSFSKSLVSATVRAVCVDNAGDADFSENAVQSCDIRLFGFSLAGHVNDNIRIHSQLNLRERNAGEMPVQIHGLKVMHVTHSAIIAQAAYDCAIFQIFRHNTDF